MPQNAFRFATILLLFRAIACAGEVVIKTFPGDVEIRIVDVSGVERSASPREEDSGWRRIETRDGDEALVLAAVGFETKRIYLGEDDELRIEERLEPQSGVLHLIQELPTGPSPKAVVFLPNGDLSVTELRGLGLSVYDADGRRRCIEIPPGGGSDSGFVEMAVLSGRRELWVSQMNTDRVHVLNLDDLSYRASSSSGGRWPKVIVASPDERFIYVANWEGRNVGVISTETSSLAATIDVDGEPRGLAFSGHGRFLWVCLFDSGAVEIIDTLSRTVVDRIDRGGGAARHIVASHDGTVMFVSDMLRGTVSKIDAARREVVLTRHVGTNVNTIALSPDGRLLFVSERGRNNPESYLIKGPVFGRLIVLDSETLETVQEVWGRHQPTGLAVRDDGLVVAMTDFLDDNLALFAVDRYER